MRKIWIRIGWAAVAAIVAIAQGCSSDKASNPRADASERSAELLVRQHRRNADGLTFEDFVRRRFARQMCSGTTAPEMKARVAREGAVQDPAPGVKEALVYRVFFAPAEPSAVGCRGGSAFEVAAVVRSSLQAPDCEQVTLSGGIDVARPCVVVQDLAAPRDTSVLPGVTWLVDFDAGEAP